MKYKCLNPTNFPNPGGNNRLRLVLVALLCAGVVFGCAQIRKATYPNDYVYLERDQLRSKMVLLSFYDLLNKIKGLTAEFGGGVTTNHLVIDEHIDDFKIDVSNAIRDARANPPNYYALGRLTGSCVGCHKYRN
jgi:hypothetical protein